MSELDVLVVRNLVAAREFIRVSAERDLICLGYWSCDWAEADREAAAEIAKALAELGLGDDTGGIG